MSDQFSFTVTDAARFLGKSAVTLRMWERRGLYRFPRLGTDRRLSCADMRELAAWCVSTSRITSERQRKIEAALTLLEIIEHEDRSPGRTRSRQD